MCRLVFGRWRLAMDKDADEAMSLNVSAIVSEHAATAGIVGEGPEDAVGACRRDLLFQPLKRNAPSRSTAKRIAMPSETRIVRATPAASPRGLVASIN